jgi:hypothetical protein
MPSQPLQALKQLINELADSISKAKSFLAAGLAYSCFARASIAAAVLGLRVCPSVV